MKTVMQWLRSFGNAGAVANASASLAQHQREEQIVAELAQRVRVPARRVPTAA